ASGYVDAIAATRSMATAAMREGVSIREGSQVLGIAAAGGRVLGVETTEGPFPAGTVVCAAGRGTRKLLASAGVSVPMETLRVQIASVRRPMELEEPHFAYIDTAAGMYCRPWGPGRTLIGVGGGDQHDVVDPERYDERNDPDYPALAIAAAARRFPAM